MAKYSKNGFRSLRAAWNLRKSIPLVFHLMKDHRVARSSKIIFVAVSLGYLLLPYDFILDIPFVGQIDDLAVFIFMINWLIRRVPKTILEQYGWHEKEA